MGFFGVKSKELETLIHDLEINKSNNYKDAAQRNFVELKKHFAELM